jgi:recombination protein U
VVLIRFGAKSNLGNELETLLDMACRQYYIRRIATIQKVPTPYKIIGTTDRGLIAIPKEKSTVDYIGQYQGIPFAMEAKKTDNKTLFRIDPWKREAHQREFFERWEGLKFYLISFWKLQEHYLIPYKDINFKDKKIPISWFRDNHPKVPSDQGIILNFLVIAKNYIREENFNADNCNSTCYRAVPP